MNRPRKLAVAATVLILLIPLASLGETPNSCPVLPTLASSKLSSEVGEHIVIWFYNQGNKTTHGIQFALFMLDAVGNRYPASQKYVVTGEIKPDTGDVVDYPTDKEREFFGENWAQVEGVEVRVTRIMFKDGSVWVPQKGRVCKMTFLNGDYQAEMDRRWKAAEKRQQHKTK